MSRGDKRIALYPSDHFKVTYSISYDHPLLRHQSRTLRITEESFIEEVAPARTFTFLKDVEMLRQNGLALGGSLENAIVLGETGVLNNALRFEDEFVRHKILDAVGDLALVGYPVIGHLVAHRAGHALHTEFAAEDSRRNAGVAAGRSGGRRPRHPGVARRERVTAPRIGPALAAHPDEPPRARAVCARWDRSQRTHSFLERRFGPALLEPVHAFEDEIELERVPAGLWKRRQVDAQIAVLEPPSNARGSRARAKSRSMSVPSSAQSWAPSRTRRRP